MQWQNGALNISKSNNLTSTPCQSKITSLVYFNTKSRKLIEHFINKRYINKKSEEINEHNSKNIPRINPRRTL